MPYCENQRGGLCRMHSLNHYFGKAQLTESSFGKFMADYDIEYKERYGSKPSCKNWDIVESDQKNIVSFILKHHGVYSRYFALNQMYGKNLSTIMQILKGDIFFIFNEGHIWNICRENKKWMSVNSIGGVRPFNINSLTSTKNVGYIVPVDIIHEFTRNLSIIKKILHAADQKKFIEQYLIKLHADKKVLGDLEIPLGIIMDILRTKSFERIKKNKFSEEFSSIAKHIVNYDDFLIKYQDNCNDIALILKYLPDILANLCDLF